MSEFHKEIIYTPVWHKWELEKNVNEICLFYSGECSE